MFTHVMIGSNDLDQSKRFYDATFLAIGGERGVTDAGGRLVYAHPASATAGRGNFLNCKKKSLNRPAVAGFVEHLLEAAHKVH